MNKIFLTLLLSLVSVISFAAEPGKDNPAAKAAAQADEHLKNQAIRKHMEELRFDDAAKYAELIKLRKDNYKEFVVQAFKLAEAESNSRKQENTEFQAIVQKYQTKPSEELKKQINGKLEQAFQRRVERERKIIALLENTAKERKQKLEKQLSNRNKIIQNQFKQITVSPANKW